MDVTTSYLTTQRAAQLLKAHESSVKRWCNAETLACTYTPGGHRRIPLDGLLQFAQQQDLPCSLLKMQPFEEDVWQGINQIWSDETFDSLITLGYTLLEAGHGDLFIPLLEFALEMDIPLPSLLDRLLSPVVHRIGDAWHNGALTVGDEHRMTEFVRDSLYALMYTLPSRPSRNAIPRPVAVVGCGRTETHNLGALMIRLLLKTLGWSVVYLGGSVPTEDLVLQQIKHKATLVCVSFAPPQAIPEALHTIRMLEQWYDAENPYRLALGGKGLQRDKIPSELSPPFLDMQWFEDTQTFSRWLDGEDLNGA